MLGFPLVSIILAGGKSSRMGGGDKCLLPLGTSTILKEVVTRLAAQVDAICLNANGDSTRFNAYGLAYGLPNELDVIADTMPDCGPLGGILAGMEWAQERHPAATHILTVAADTPFLPLDLASKLAAQMKKTPRAVIIATSRGQFHPTFALWPMTMRKPLDATLKENGAVSVRRFAESHGEIVTVDFPFVDGHDPFYNINDAQGLAEADHIFRTRNP